ncbi:hypothetical protein M5689_019143 [Euphorbia peplus]|nr:hypothetical protein M5689_019143 [Euphorbia peplus]
MSSVAKLTVISHWDNSLDGATIISVEREYANNALQFYEKTQDDKLEIVQVLFSNRAKQHIFCEIVLDRDSEKYNVTYCSKFEPSDPGNVNGCVFCPAFEIFVHPPGGCPAGAQENDNLMTQGVVASKDQIRRCSKRHKSRPNVVFDNVATEMFDKARKVIKLKYAKIALEIFRKSKDAEFEIVEVLHAIREYNATYCEIFKPSDRSVTHNCIICPQPWKHPFKGYHVGRLPYSIAEDE